MASEHQVALLAEALGKCLVASGIVRADADLTGPHLLMFAEDLERFLKEATTRPAPAATDTGLVTYSQYSKSVHDFDGTYLHDETYLAPGKNGEWVKRSQAEKLLAAERVEKEQLRRKMNANDRRAITAESRLSQSEAELKQARADNAALTARVKELEQLLEASHG